MRGAFGTHPLFVGVSLIREFNVNYYYQRGMDLGGQGGPWPPQD